MATVRQLPNGRWRCEVYRNGLRRSKVLDTKARAAAWGREMEECLSRGETGRTFADAAERYLREIMPHKRGRRKETLRLHDLVRHLGAYRLVEIDSAVVSAWRDQRITEVAVWSVLREANILRSVFRAAREWRWMSGDPFDGVRMPRNPPPRHQRWRWQQIRRVLRFLGYRRGETPRTKYQEVALAFMISLSTGLRAGEVLQVGPATLHGRVLTLRATKSDPYVRVPLTARGARYCGLVQRWTITPASLDAIFRKARDACLVQDVRFHDARASALTWLSRKVDILTLSRISRHKDLRILQNVYYRETAEEIARRLR